MYTKKIEIEHYGPISLLDIDLPFNGDTPKPVVLVGENGSGKSISLSHIMNGLAEAKSRAYPETPEVATGMVFKIRSPFYVKSGSLWSYARVVFEQNLFLGELTLSSMKGKLGDISPEFTFQNARDGWNQLADDENSRLISNFDIVTDTKFREFFGNNCVLYFPHNRFEEPAWLNEENLKAQAKYMNIEHTQGYTSRRIINYSSLNDNQNWLFDVVYDMTAFETRTENLVVTDSRTNRTSVISEWKGYLGDSTNIYGIALDVTRRVMRHDRRLAFSIGRRLNRTISLRRGGRTLVPNIFQLSSGETSLLNLFFSILRDFNLSRTSFSSAHEVRGIVVVDEIDLHLHAVHQYEILPSLIQMFPKVQFIVTTHSPLFVLGMNNAFGEDGFALYRLPDGQQISPEEFSEFGSAYEVFRSSSAFSDDVRLAVRNAQRPILYMEGDTDITYLRKAADLLRQDAVLASVELREGGGDRLRKVWKEVAALPEELVPRKVMVLRDCDYTGEAEDKGHRLKRKIPKKDGHPIEKGIENLFSQATIEKARSHKHAYIDVTDAHIRTERGEQRQIPETWTVNENEKKNLCDWLCEDGTAEDFQHFQVIFDLLDELLDEEQDA